MNTVNWHYSISRQKLSGIYECKPVWNDHNPEAMCRPHQCMCQRHKQEHPVHKTRQVLDKDDPTAIKAMSQHFWEPLVLSDNMYML